jgi:hypothetical protein
MIDDFGLDSHSSAASIVKHFGDAAPDMVAAAAVARLEMQDFEDYVVLKRILKDVEEILAGRSATEAQ